MKTTILTKGIKKVSEELEVSVDEITRKIALTAYNGITRKTPVLSGRARGNWNLSIGSPDSTINENATQIKPAKLKKGDGLEAIYITNNLPYIRRLEYGHSKIKAPKGMVRVTLAEIKNQFR